MVSFQLGFFALTKQAGGDPWGHYPEGTFGVGFATIIGDTDFTMDLLQNNPLGVPLLSLYALIAQVMLVNLLIGKE